MLDELKKITSKLYVKILILIVIIASIIVSIASIRSFSEIESADGTNYLQGKAAVNLLKERYNNSKGSLTTDKINDVLKYYKSMPGKDDAYLKTDIEYPGIISLIEDAYAYDNEKDENKLAKITDVSGFYEKNVEVISKKISDSNLNYEQWEKDIILEKASNIDKPFNIDFRDHWIKIYPALTVGFIVIAITAVIIGAGLFSYEKENNMDILLVSIGDKSLKKIGSNKIKALLTYLTMEFLISVIIISVLIFVNTGVSAWNSQIQIEYFTSIYNLTFGQAYMMSLFAGWISIMAIGTFVAALNAFKQKSYITLVVGVILTFIPMIIVKINVFPSAITKFFRMQPINGLFITKNLQSLQIFNFLFTHTLTITAVIIDSIIILAICIFLAPRLFSARIKNS